MLKDFTQYKMSKSFEVYFRTTELYENFSKEFENILKKWKIYSRTREPKKE